MSTTKPRLPLLASLDIGSTKVAYIIGAVTPEGHLEVVGVGQSPNVGMKQGVVVNIDATTESIRKAKEEAELMSGYSTNNVWLSVSGTHIQSFDSKGMVAIKNREVTASEIERVIDAAKAVAVPADRKVLHVLPREFKVDGQDGIIDPVGMTGIRLEANVHIITGSQSAISNSIRCVEKAGLKVSGIVLGQLASATAVAAQDEKNLGVCVVDMGGGTCNLLYYVNGSVAHSSTIPVGGQHVTHDIAVGLRTPQFAAEILKKKHGSALAAAIQDNESVEVEGVGGRKTRSIPRKDLADVVSARAEETLNLIANDLRLSGLMPMLGSGIILTGGASQLEGLSEMGEFIFDIPVRKGVARDIGGLSDVVRHGELATAVGLLQYGFQETKESIIHRSEEIDLSESIDGIAKKVKDFFGQIF